MKKRVTKRILSMLTALMLVVSMLAVNVYADTEGLLGEPSAVVEAEDEVSVDEAVPEAAAEDAAPAEDAAEEETEEAVTEEAAEEAAEEEAAEEPAAKPEAEEAAPEEAAEEEAAPAEEETAEEEAAAPAAEEKAEEPAAEEKAEEKAAEPEKIKTDEEEVKIEKAKAEGTVPIAIADCIKIGVNPTLMNADIYYKNIGAAGTVVEFTDLADSMEDGMISGLNQSGYVDGTNVVDLTEGFGLTWEFLDEEYGDYLDEDACEGLDFSNIYGLFVMNDDADAYIFIIQGPSKQFSLSTGQIIGFEENGLDYVDYVPPTWDPVPGTMDLYTVAVPTGIESVEITFKEDRIVYAYDANGGFIDPCGAEGDGSYANNGQTGQTKAVVKALADGTMPKYVYVQTPYTEDSQTTHLFAISFEMYTFEASYNGRPLTNITFTPAAYTYYDYMTGGNQVAGVYTIVIPNDAETIDFTVSRPVLHYNYTKEGEYLGGWVTNFQEGDSTFSQAVDYGDSMTTADGVLDYIQIQVPYDAAYNSLLLYCIAFEYVDPIPDPGQNIEDVPQNVADIYSSVGAKLYASLTADPSYIESGEWYAMDLARAGYDIPEEYYQNVLLKVYEKDGKLTASDFGTVYVRVVLALTAGGKDPGNVAGYDLLKNFSDYDAVMSLGINGPVFALIALDSGNYAIPEVEEGKTQATREGYIAAILEAQHEDGGWAYGADEASDPDMTAMALQALAPYYQVYSDVKAAVDKALELLSAVQTEDGTYLSADAANAATCESSAQVAIALVALGINPDTDARFVKGENSVIDGLCSFATEGGFKHVATGSLNTMATEQGYRALVSYYRFLESKTSLYNMTDMELSMIGADYTAVDAALAKIPADLSLYTEETAAAVTAASDAVVRTKMAAEQADVDAWTEAILEAYYALEPLTLPYDGTAATFVKSDGKSQFGMLTPQAGSTVIRDGDDIVIHIIPKNKTTYAGFKWGSVTAKELTDGSKQPEMDVQFNADGTIDITLDKDKCGSMYPIAVVKKTFGKGTWTSDTQYYLAIPAVENFADYASVVAALAKVPENLNVYSETTAAAMSAAVEAVDFTKTAAEQADVDAWAEALWTAYYALEPLTLPYTRNEVNFVKSDGSQFGMWTPQSGTTAILEGDNVVVHFVPKNKTTYAGFKWGSVTAKEFTDGSKQPEMDVLTNEDGTIDLTISKDKCGSMYPIAVVKKTFGKGTWTSGEQYYLAVPAEDAFETLADYSAVVTAILKIPENLSDYTKASAQAVVAAKNAVVLGKMAAEQRSVDEMAAAIEAAIAALVEIAPVEKVTLKKTSFAYTGKAIKPEIKSVTATVNGETVTLTKDDYTVSYKNNTNAGTGTVTVTGKGDFKEKAKATFKITKVKLASAKLKSSYLYYTGKALKQSSITVKAKVNGKTVTLKSGTDYSVSYKNNKNVGIATVTVTGKGNFTGSIKKPFEIRPKTTSISKLTSAKSGQLTIKWKKQDTQIDGYQIWYGTDKNFKTKTSKKIKKGTYTKTYTKLKAGKTYYVKVRTYKTVNGKTYYSKWSAVKSIKVKK